MSNLPSNFKDLQIDLLSYGVDNNSILNVFYYKDETGKYVEYRTRDLVREEEEKIEVVSVGEEVNGFRRVMFSNGKVGFQDREGNVLQYRFSIASDFNEYGFAMIGTSDGVTWINREFKKLTSRGSWTILEDKFALLPTGVSEYVNGLSIISFNRRSKRQTFVLDTNGQKVVFRDSKRDLAVEFESQTDIRSSLAEDGYQITSKGIFFANGTFMMFEDLVDLSEIREVLGNLGASAFEQEKLRDGKRVSLMPNASKSK